MPDVLVVGAGPVGLTMAAELVRHGVRCRIIDRLPLPSPYCRAIGVTARTLELWEDMGIVAKMIDAGLWLRATCAIINGSEPREFQTNFPDLPYGHLGLPQPETERILTEHLASFGIEVERPVALASFEQDQTSVHATLSHLDGTTEIAAFRYIVGCDGAHSTVRRASGIQFEGDQFPVNFMLGDILLNSGLARGVVLRIVQTNENGAPDFLMAVPLPERNRYRVSMLAPEQDFSDGDAHGLQTERTPPTIGELQQVADRLLPGKIRMSDMRWSSLFRISMRLAARYRNGRAFLTGDAAHIHPPTGGQGMNTGIQDAYNLAWKMALVLKGAVSEDLLESYEAERRPVGAEVVARTRAQSERFGREQPDPKARYADTQILVNYRGTRWSKDQIDGSADDLAVRAGDRAPDCHGLCREGIHYPLRLFDVIRGPEYVLIVYFAKPLLPEEIDEFETFAGSLKRIVSGVVRVAAIFAAQLTAQDIAGASTFHDSDNSFASTYSAIHKSGYLIRPDDYCAYNGRPLEENRFMQHLRDLGFGLPGSRAK